MLSDPDHGQIAPADSESNNRWLYELVCREAEKLAPETPIVVDAVRNAAQLEVFRQQVKFEVSHVHLYASKALLEERLRERGADLEEIDLIKTEDDISAFRHDADVRVFTDRTDTEDTLTRVAGFLGLYPAPDLECVDVIVGGQYGSEGKGQVAAYLSREYDVLMRVGGPNAGHKAARESGKYTYHSLPSGSREFSGDILIGPGATIQPEELLSEISDCGVTPERLYLDPNVMVITDEDRSNETGLIGAIGSTGRGGGSAAARRILDRKPGRDGAQLARDTPSLEPYVKSTHERLQKAYLTGENVLLEGTQGSLLSIYHGAYPYVTSRDTNVAGCLAEAGIPPRRVRRVMMVFRYTPIRVQSPPNGTSGSLKHETDFLSVAKMAGIEEDLEANEKTSTTNLDRRVGWFEWEKFRLACELNSPTDIVLTFADYQHVSNRDARRFEQLNPDLIKFIEELERVAQAPVSIINTRYPHDEDEPLDLRTLIDRRYERSKFKL